MMFIKNPIRRLFCLLFVFSCGTVYAAEKTTTKTSDQTEAALVIKTTVEAQAAPITPVVKPVVKEDWYSVEFIIFKHNTAETQLTEPWEGTPLSITEDPVFLNTPHAENMGVFSLGSRQRQLYGVYSRLKKLRAYTPIKHTGWIQRAEKNSSVIQVSITPTMEHNRLEGSINLRRGRYTHLDVDLQLNETDSYPSYTNTGTQVIKNGARIYRLTETRRIKKGDINYFDHPRFGVIAKIEKIDSPHRATKQEALVAEPLEKLEVTKEPVAPSSIRNDN